MSAKVATVAWVRRQDWVLAAQLGCALVVTFHAEYTLALAAGVHHWVALAVPGALDLYVIRALQKHRDVFLAVLVMVAANVASHLVAAGLIPVGWGVYSAVGGTVPLLLWRGHALRYARTRKELLWGTPAGTDPEAPGEVSAPVPEASTEQVRDVPETVPSQVSAYPDVPETDRCTGTDECRCPWCAAPVVPDPSTDGYDGWEAKSLIHPHAPDHVPDEWPVRHLVPVPDLESGYGTGTPGTVVHSAELEPGDAEYVPAAREYVRGTQRPSIAGMKAAANVGQDRARRLLAYLETEEK